MKKILLLLGLCLFLVFAFRCNQLENKSTTKNTQLQASELHFSVVDSLKKYYNADSVLLIDDSLQAVLFIGKIDNYNYAVYAISDSILIFYQHKKNNEWIATDTLEYKLSYSYAECIDLNGDNVKDIKISCFSGSAGNTENKVFLFNQNSKLFTHNAYYDLPNVDYDTTNRFVKSSWYAGVVHCQSKWTYKITGDSLISDIAVSYCPDENNNGKTATIQFYKRQGKKEITTKEIKGDSEKLWDVFVTTFWDSTDELEGLK